MEELNKIVEKFDLKIEGKITEESVKAALLAKLIETDAVFAEGLEGEEPVADIIELLEIAIDGLDEVVEDDDSEEELLKKVSTTVTKEPKAPKEPKTPKTPKEPKTPKTPKAQKEEKDVSEQVIEIQNEVKEYLAKNFPADINFAFKPVQNGFNVRIDGTNSGRNIFTLLNVRPKDENGITFVEIALNSFRIMNTEFETFFNEEELESFGKCKMLGKMPVFRKIDYKHIFKMLDKAGEKMLNTNKKLEEKLKENYDKVASEQEAKKADVLAKTEEDYL